LLIVLAAALGGGAGLLAPRSIYRLSVATGEPWRTACPRGHPLPRGAAGGWIGAATCRKAGCGPYGPTAGATSVAAALIAALLAAATGWRPELLVWLLLTPGAVVLAAVDHRVHRLPDILTLPMAGTTLTLLALASVQPSHHGSFATAALGAPAVALGLLVQFLIYPRGLGLGDCKLGLLTGAVLGWYGWKVLIVGTALGFAFGALWGCALLLTRRADRQTSLAFGPLLLLSALLGVLLGASDGL